MFRSKKTQLQALFTSGLLLAGACTDQTAVDPISTAEVEEAHFSKAAVAGLAPGVAQNDTSILVTSSLRVFWYEPTITYAQSGRNKVAVTPIWTVRNTNVLSIASVSGMYVNLSPKAAGSSYIVGKVGSRIDSVKITVTAASAPPVTPPTTPTTPTTPTPPVNPPTTPTTPSGNLTYIVPTLPATLTVSYPTVTGTTIRVAAGGNLQAALDAARPGDEVVLANGATFTGNFTLPKKTGSGWVLLRGESVPAAGQRASTSNSAATVITNNSVAAITAAAGSHHWYLAGFNVRLAPIAAHNSNVIRLGNGFESTAAELVNDFVLDRMIVSGSTSGGTSRCVAMNGARQAVINSQLLECHAKGSDAQAIGGWGGAGPFLIENNRLEGSGETIMFGGADPVQQIVPSDITIRRNYFTRPLSWSGVWSIKNILELKNAQRVLVEGNVLENNWADGQVGFAMLFKAVSQDDRAPWSTMQDITVRNNLIRNSTSGVNIAYRTSTVPTVGSSRILISNNVFENVGKDPVSGIAWDGRIFQLLDQVTDVTILNNTITLSGAETGQAVGMDGASSVRLTIVNNVFPATLYGIKGSGAGIGSGTLSRYAVNGVVQGNVFPKQDASIFPANNFFPSSATTILFQALASGDFSLSSSNAFFSGVFGKIGVDNTALSAAISGVR
jgi:hypothetical protein